MFGVKGKPSFYLVVVGQELVIYIYPSTLLTDIYPSYPVDI